MNANVLAGRSAASRYSGLLPSLPMRVRPGRFIALFATAAICLATSFSAPARAEVVRFEITERTPLAQGHRFGDVGAYELIVGKVHFAIDPQAQGNRPIVDLQYAPRNDRGLVEFSSDLVILAPADIERGNGALLLDVNNRGNILALRFFNTAPGGNQPQTPEELGNGFLMRQGFTLVSVGWDGELLPGENRLRLHAPVARPQDGQGAITGLVRCEFVPDRDLQRMPPVNWTQHASYYPVEASLPNATLTVRERAADPRQLVPREQWTLHVTPADDPHPGQLPLVEVECPAGLKAGHIYELIYEARDPLVHGVCFAAVRDLTSALKHGQGQDNPLATPEKRPLLRAHGFGVSQTGRFLREFTYRGFNADEQGRQVFDGIIPHVSGAGLGSFNHRFAQPTRHASQHDHSEYPADRFPFAYEVQFDPLSQRGDGLLRKAAMAGVAPLVMHTYSSAEYWTRAGSLPHTDPLGTRDAQPPANVRIYAFGGTQHGPGAYPPVYGPGKYPNNPGDYRPLLRALLLALDAWARDGATPPDSVYPRIADGTLVAWDQASTGFPQLPGVEYPQVIRQPRLLDLGPRWRSHGIIDVQPPRPLGDYVVLVPKCDADGQDLGCLQPPEVAAPLATFTGWNLRSATAGGENELVSLVGSYLPFPTNRQQREATGDPRRSLVERYGDVDGYRRALSAACDKLIAGGYLLEEDRQRALELFPARWPK